MKIELTDPQGLILADRTKYNLKSKHKEKQYRSERKLREFAAVYLNENSLLLPVRGCCPKTLTFLLLILSSRGPERIYRKAQLLRWSYGARPTIALPAPGGCS